MPTLQKFKFLATHCAVIGSPNPSPTTSPVLHLRRRKTLRMLLRRSANNNHPPRDNNNQIDDNEQQDQHRRRQQQNHRHQICVRHKLKDLFVDDPNGIDIPPNRIAGRRDLLPPPKFAAIRPLSATFRHRLFRRPWRPVLLAIPEQSP